LTHQPTVWIVDDAPFEADVIRRALEPANVVRTFHDGAAALEQLSSEPLPDVLVLDWRMPNLSGIEICRFLRARLDTLTLPILMLTAHQDTDDLVTGLAAGADDYVTKPFRGEELAARVAALVRSRRLLERVEDAERSVRALLMQLPDAVVTLDARQNIVFANEEAGRALGSTSLVGRPLAEVLPSVDARAIAALPPGISSRDVKIGERAYSASCRSLRRGSDELTLTLHDVTEQRRAAARRLDFYSIIAHDLRNPLSGIMLRASLLQMGKRGALPPAANEELQRIQSHIRGLVELINDFLDFARIDATEMRTELSDADLCDVVRAAIDLARPLADGKDVAVSFAAPPDPVMAEVDPRRVVQVITNLVTNAVKFSPPRGVVHIELREAADAVEIDVTDKGVGIAPELVARLFQRYVRAPAAGSTPGTGLGLLIVREVVEAHGGKVSVTSKPGEGSTFTVSLPRGAASRQQAQRA
jgi:two-component system phosphate regulon sensor histidine kinase PhoR